MPSSSWLDLLRLLDDRGHHPALAGAERPALGDRDLVADLGLVLLVMREERGGPLRGLAVERIADLPLARALYGPVLLVAGDGASDRCLGGHRLHRLLLAQRRLDARQITAQQLQFVAGLELAHRLLDPEAEHLVVEILDALLQLVGSEVAKFCDLHTALSSAKRVANLVLMGNLAAARRSASFASTSVTPSISKRIRPGRTTHTHSSGAPLPLPMRTSCGFLVIGLSGDTRTQIFPPRLVEPGLATRGASICRAVIQQGSRALRP